MDLKDVVIRAQVGDQDAYATLYRRFRDMALQYAYSILGDHDLAEDARQEAFINAYCDMQALRTPSAFPGWFRQIVRKHSIAIARRRRGLVVPLERLGGVADGGPGAVERLDGDQRMEVLLRAIDRLPTGEGDVVRLYYLNDLSLREIGLKVGLAEKTVKSRLHTARARLRGELFEKVKIVVKRERLSGDRRARESATQEAIRMFGEEISQLLRVPTDEEQRRAGELVCARGRLLRFMGKMPEALQAFESGLTIPALKEDRLHQARLYTEMGLTLIQTSDYEGARAQLQRSRALVAPRADGAGLLAVIYNGLGLCAWGEGDWRRGQRYYTQALETSREVGLEDLQAQVLNNLALLDWKQGRLADSRGRYRDSMKIWRKLGNRFGRALATMNLAIVEENMGQTASARRHYQDALGLGEELGYEQLRGACHANLSNLALDDEDFGAAEAEAKKALEIARKIGDRRSQAIALENLALAQLGQGRRGEAGKSIVAGKKIALAIGDAERAFSLDLVEIERELKTRQADNVPRWLDKAQAALDAGGYEAERPRLARLRASASAKAGNLTAARRFVEEGLSHCGKQGNGAEERRIRDLGKQLDESATTRGNRASGRKKDNG